MMINRVNCGSTHAHTHTLIFNYDHLFNQPGRLSTEQKSYSTTQRSIESLQKDMVKMNMLISSKKGEQDKLEQGNSLIEKDFVHSLKVSFHSYMLYQLNMQLCV